MQVKSFVLAISILLAFQSPLCGWGKAAAVENQSAKSASSKLLKGGVNSFGVLTEKMLDEIGLSCVEDENGLLVSQVGARSKALTSGLQEGDFIFSAKIEKEILVLEVMRDDKQYKCSISLSNKLKALKPVFDTPRQQIQRTQRAQVAYQPTRNTTYQKPINPNDGPCIRIAFFGPQQIETYQRTTSSGFDLNQQDITNIYGMDAEYKSQNSSDGGWAAVNTATYEFAKVYTDRNWPKELIGHRTYHLKLRKDGSFISCQRMFQPRYDRKSANEAMYERLCQDFLNKLNRGRILAIPRGSNLNKWNCMMVFCNRFERSE